MKNLVAVAIADVHLSAEPPRFRAVEENWLNKQAAILQQVFTIAKNKGNPVPLLIAGDLFNTAMPSPEIINFALDIFSNLPFPIYAIPGNHDLPNHRYEEMKRSAYGTLVRARRLENIPIRGFLQLTPGVRVWGYPCGVEVAHPPRMSDKCLQVALVHSYIWWMDSHRYKGAPEDQQASHYLEKLKGHDVAVFGDNHCGFIMNRSDCSILNCGTLLVRKSDERKIGTSSAVGLIYNDGSVDRQWLDISSDKYSDLPSHEEEGVESLNLEEKEALKAFSSLSEQSIDYAECLRHLVQQRNFRIRVKELVLESIGDK